MSVTYKQSGVDIDAAEDLVARIKPLAAATRVPEVVDDVGGFAGLVRLPSDIPDPLLVSGTDGVGTKLKLAFATGKHDTIGQDLVAMCVNDVITTGARPLYFLDYFGCGKLDVSVAERVIAGIADGCKIAGCALIGGETAELPGMYADGEYDLAGFAVGVVSASKVLGPRRVQDGDALIAIASSGLHSNGYSLARRVLEGDGSSAEAAPAAARGERGRALTDVVPALGVTLGEALLTPTRIYAQATRALSEALGSQLHALCHVTGGGLIGNLPRVLPRGAIADVRLDHERHPLFELIASDGPVAEEEMRRTFNLGIGMVAVVAASAAERAISVLKGAGEHAWSLGAVRLEGEEPARVEVA
ncbi:MAG: phosphoribosylformylglycinamidine cyclo-ligase [Polyangiaceae bacterium]|nr:phosphoribosylformylglycinamidine cyclo-ligase [Polyangiaceae bacterium]MCW5792319.1 phosphoribosylformylglycinamidine cyclo-ligase [Polyangiaceae bacterium]